MVAIGRPFPFTDTFTDTFALLQGGNEISYIEWHVACQYLDFYALGWSWRILSVRQVGNLVTIHERLSIPSSDGIVERDATGIEEIDAKGYGDAVSNAAAMAFKRRWRTFWPNFVGLENDTVKSSPKHSVRFGSIPNLKQSWKFRKRGERQYVDPFQ